MKEWVLNISVTVLLLAILSLILPSGKTSKIIKSVTSLVLVFVIISPLINLSKQEINTDDLFNTSEIEYQENYLFFVEKTKIDEYEKNCIKIIENLGIKLNGNELNIISDNEPDGIVNVQKVTINLQDSVIISDKENIDIIDKVLSSVSSYLSIDKERIEIYD